MIVHYKSGRPAKGVKVSNGYTLESDHTNDSGTILFELDTRDTELYIEGRERGNMRPGKTVVTLGT